MIEVSPTQEICLRDAVRVWCPNYPRRVTNYQMWAENEDDLLKWIRRTNGKTPGYISTYSFPNGHTTENAVPLIDTLFLDWDIPGDGRFGRPASPADANLHLWYQDMKELLAVVADVASFIVESGKKEYVRFSLSGYKGIHLYIDLADVSNRLGPTEQYSSGMSSYVSKFVGAIEDEIGYSVSRWLDVDSSDLSRLTRLPNTIHDGATEMFGEPRYCVPVSVDEILEMTPGEYVRLTQQPRLLPEGSQRVESTQATARLTAEIYRSKSSTSSASQSNHVGLTIGEYEKVRADYSYSFDGPYNSVLGLFSHKTCMLSWRTREDAFNHGSQSHVFETAVINELLLNDVPVELILQFLETIPRYDEVYSRKRIADVLEQNYEYPYSASKLARACPVFVDTDDCPHCMSVAD